MRSIRVADEESADGGASISPAERLLPRASATAVCRETMPSRGPSGPSRPLVPRLASKSTPNLFRPNSVQAAAIMSRDDPEQFTSEAKVQHAFMRAWWMERTSVKPKPSAEKVTYLQSANRNVGYEPMRSYRNARKWDEKDGTRRYAPAGLATLEPPTSDVALVGGSLLHDLPPRPASQGGLPRTPSTLDSLAVRTAARIEAIAPPKGGSPTPVSGPGSPSFLPGGQKGWAHRRVSKEIMGDVRTLPGRMRRTSKELVGGLAGRVRRISKELSASRRPQDREAQQSPSSVIPSSPVREQRLQSRQEARRVAMFQ